MKLVDYGGRIYDLETGRFLSPDPAGAEENPYAYVQNNPETLTDPTGYFSFGDVVKIAAIAVVSYITAGAAAGAAGGWGSLGGSLAGGATGGFTSGFLGSDGNLRAGFIGAIGGAAMGGIGFEAGQNLTTGELVGRSVVEGAVGGVLSEAAGGNFGDGFLGAFASSMAGPQINHITGDNPIDIAARYAASAALGGTVSRLNGGSFANGAISAAFERMFNGDPHSSSDPDIGTYNKNDPNYHYYEFEDEICEGWEPGCTPENVYAGSELYPFPGATGEPMANNSIHEITFLGIHGGHVRTVFDPSSLSLDNITEPDHIFYRGYVERTVVSHDGNVYIRTVGEGVDRNWFYRDANVVLAHPGFEMVNSQIRNWVLSHP